jgi:hypothetical protein
MSRAKLVSDGPPADLSAALPPSLVQFERLAHCGVGPDAPEHAMALFREFVLKRWINFPLCRLNRRRHPLGLNT